MKNNVFITNEEEFEKIKEVFKKWKKEDFFIVSDFDKTLTHAFIHWKLIPSLISFLRNGNYLWERYSKEAHNLFNYYYPIEISPQIRKEEKKQKMQEWWEKHFLLLHKYRLSKEMIEEIMYKWEGELREKSKDFFSFLDEKNIPLIIFSASGLGIESIKFFLERHNLLFQNISLVSNRFLWDEDGKLKDFKKPLIHTLNKEISIIKDAFPEIYKKIQSKKYVILLGDTIWDTFMLDGFECENIIKIGFLNHDEESLFSEYQKRYDVIITKDGDMSFVCDFLREVIE